MPSFTKILPLLLALLVSFQIALANPVTFPQDTYATSRIAARNAIPAQVKETNAGIVKIRTFDPATLGALYCNLPSFGAVSYQSLFDQISYLQQETQQPCDAPAHTCVRVSCSLNTAVYLCNDRDDHIYPNCPDIASYAEYIYYHCGDGADQMVQGQLFDLGNWNVIVRSDTC